LSRAEHGGSEELCAAAGVAVPRVRVKRTGILAAVALQAVVGALFGFPLISTGIFVAGIVAILIDIDYFRHAGRKVFTPIAHSLLFAALWIYMLSLALYLSYIYGGIDRKIWVEGTLAVVSGYSSHLAIDSVTAEGIYTIPRSGRLRSWMRTKNGIWKEWGVFSFSGRMRKSRGEEDPLMNAGICVASLVMILIFIALV